MTEYALCKLMGALCEADMAVKAIRIRVLRIDYRKSEDDMRESTSVEIMELIEAKGGIVAYSDPHVPVFPKMREHHFTLSSEVLNAETLARFDAVVLATDHDRFDYELIKSAAKLIIDTRGKYRAPAAHIIKA